MLTTYGYAGFDEISPLKPFAFNRREMGERDVHIEIQFCGVCHSDIHSVRNEWGGAVYPFVPGHEIVGWVKAVGAGVTAHQVGDVVGVGCMVNSCGECVRCQEHSEQFCQKGSTFTYNSVDKDGDTTKGGYSNQIVVNEKFVLKVPSHLPLAAVAPLLCAGITTYSPLKRWNIGKSHRVGIVGLGGLGHMAVKFARAFGAYVVVFTTSEHKKQEAIKLGAHEVVFSKNPQEMKMHLNQLDFILDTVSAIHPMDDYLSLLSFEGTLCMLGVSPSPLAISPWTLIDGRKIMTGSLIGGIKETQEMLAYCGKHNITSDIELIPIEAINEAYARILKGDVKYRFVIDMQTLKPVAV